jgi:hypothetical protein
MPSERSKFIHKQKGPFVKEPELDKWYFLSEGTGSFYLGNNSVGYFQAGAILCYKTKERIEISGLTFKVTSDGPNPTWVAPICRAEGDILDSRPPIIMELSEVIQNAQANR